jgi:predicted nucleic acid-binding protein
VVKALFDTNIVLDYMKGASASRKEFSLYDDVAISIVTRMEVLVGAEAIDEQGIRAFLNGFVTVPLDDNVAERAIGLRKQWKLKLADAIIWASAQVQGRLFVTRDIKDFPNGEPGIRVPYKI